MDLFSVTVVTSPLVSLSLALITFAAGRSTWNWLVAKYNEYESKSSATVNPALLATFQALMSQQQPVSPSVTVNVNEETVNKMVTRRLEEIARNGQINNVRMPNN